MGGDIEALRERWTYLYRDYLPSLAKARDPVQARWPVHLDHCFARIVLDNAVGISKPWTQVVKAPAVKHMSAEQLQTAISLAEAIATGEADLDQLNERSLELRHKKRKVEFDGDDSNKSLETGKRSKMQKQDSTTISSYFLPSPASPKKEPSTSTIQVEDDNDNNNNSNPTLTATKQDPAMAAELTRIAESNITPFRKLTLSLLCQIPRGRYSTYQAMSDHISASRPHKTCARAVGNAMRNNPFAPEVPCHRILAADGTLGGFKGSWGEKGAFASDKHKLLYEEGVRFDSRGKVKGPVFREFR